MIWFVLIIGVIIYSLGYWRLTKIYGNIDLIGYYSLFIGWGLMFCGIFIGFKNLEKKETVKPRYEIVTQIDTLYVIKKDTTEIIIKFE